MYDLTQKFEVRKRLLMVEEGLTYTDASIQSLFELLMDEVKAVTPEKKPAARAARAPKKTTKKTTKKKSKRK